MKRFVWGIILAVLGLISLISPKPDETGMGALLMIGGGILTFFGAQYLKRVKQVTAIALQMIREDGKLDAGQLSQRMGMSEVDVRVCIAESQRKGVIPFKTEIV